MIFMILVAALITAAVAITAVVKTHQAITKRPSLRLPRKPCQVVKSLILACGLERKRFLLRLFSLNLGLVVNFNETFTLMAGKFLKRMTRRVTR
jgi:hypothetical protein